MVRLSMDLRVPASDDLGQRLELAIEQVNTVVLGKAHQVRMAFACLLAGGHLLLEDIPGVGKTTLARSLAATLGLDFQRIQFTSDLLPSDIIGISVYEHDSKRFRFHPGPVLTQVLLADEINRATPKTQSALLEAMAEGHATVDGHTYDLPHPFFVIATQNPLDLAGTYALPDSQLDRFMLCVSLGYPDATAERELLTGGNRHLQPEHLRPCLDAQAVDQLQQRARKATTSPALVAYIQDLLAASRRHPDVRTGLSPRAGLALLSAARAWATVHDRDYVVPEDVQAMFVPVAAHRLATGDTTSPRALSRDLLASTAVS